MNIGYISSDAYAPLMGTSIVSLLESNKDAKCISIRVLDDGISEENKSALDKIVKSYNRTITFIPKDEILEFVKSNGLPSFNKSPVTYTKIYADICFKDLDRILIIDCDTIINGSLESVYSIDMGNQLVAAVPELTAKYITGEDTEVLSKKKYYYNTGFLLWNIKNTIASDYNQRTIECFKGYGRKLKLADQTLLNISLSDEEVLPLPYIYNYNINLHIWDRIRAPVQEEYEQLGLGCGNKDYSRRLSGDEIVVIHYLGDKRPWIKGKYAPLSKYYKKFLKKTPWSSRKRESYYSTILARTIRSKPSSLVSNKMLGYPYSFYVSLKEYRASRHR